MTCILTIHERRALHDMGFDPAIYRGRDWARVRLIAAHGGRQNKDESSYSRLLIPGHTFHVIYEGTSMVMILMTAQG
jgi:hypothetical protein